MLLVTHEFGPFINFGLFASNDLHEAGCIFAQVKYLSHRSRNEYRLKCALCNVLDNLRFTTTHILFIVIDVPIKTEFFSKTLFTHLELLAGFAFLLILMHL